MLIRFCCLFLLVTIVCSIDTGQWDFVFSDVAYFITSNASTWRLRSSVITSDGYSPEQWDYASQAWVPGAPGGGSNNIAQDSSLVYDTTKMQQMWKRPHSASTGPSWTNLAITGFDIKISSNNQIWYVSTTATTGGYAIYKYSAGASLSISVPGAGAVKVGPSPDGNAWIVTNSGAIQRYNGTGWMLMPGNASEIVVGADGIPVILTQTVSLYGGFAVQKWNSTNSSWTTLDGIGGISIAVDEVNTIYVVTNTYDLYRLKGNMSYLCPSKLLLYIILILHLACHLNCASCSDSVTCQRCRTTLCISADQCIPCMDSTYPSRSTGLCECKLS